MFSFSFNKLSAPVYMMVQPYVHEHSFVSKAGSQDALGSPLTHKRLSQVHTIPDQRCRTEVHILPFPPQNDVR